MKSTEYQRELYYNDGSENVDSSFYLTYYSVCPEYDTCAEYLNMCQDGVDDHLHGYFECTETEGNNGQVAYIAPHCTDDGFNVTLGVYGDEDCNEYIGNGVDIANFIGEDIDSEEDALKSWYNSGNGVMDVLQYSNSDNVCILCGMSVSDRFF